jgi:hypothetical protein
VRRVLGGGTPGGLRQHAEEMPFFFRIEGKEEKWQQVGDVIGSERGPVERKRGRGGGRGNEHELN